MVPAVCSHYGNLCSRDGNLSQLQESAHVTVVYSTYSSLLKLRYQQSAHSHTMVIYHNYSCLLMLVYPTYSSLLKLRQSTHTVVIYQKIVVCSQSTQHIVVRTNYGTSSQGSQFSLFQGGVPSPLPRFFFGGYFHPLFINLEGITACLKVLNFRNT